MAAVKRRNRRWHHHSRGRNSWATLVFVELPAKVTDCQQGRTKLFVIESVKAASDILAR